MRNRRPMMGNPGIVRPADLLPAFLEPFYCSRYDAGLFTSNSPLALYARMRQRLKDEPTSLTIMLV